MPERNGVEFDDIIYYTLTRCGLKNADHVVQQLHNTAKVESAVRNVRQYGGGPALGVFQVEPRTRHDVMKHYLRYRKGLKRQIEKAIGPLDLTDEQYLLSLPAQIVFAYMCFERHRAWREDILEQAIAWKTYYNTMYGKGTIKKYVEVANGWRKV